MNMSGNIVTENGSGKSKYFNLKEYPHVVKVLDRQQKSHPNILGVIGNTPLVKLNNIPKSEGIQCEMYAKCEFLNPGGSVKDRIAFRMVEDAERNGTLIPGKSVIIEPTSGNTGIGLALAAAVKGYRCIIVLPEKMSDEKVNTLRALGAEIVRTPTEAASADPDSNISVAHRMAKEIPHALVLDQYNNPNNPLAHFDGTAEEILWALDDEVDMVVMGTGTCGTISGVGHKIKERCPSCVIVGADPYGSILAHPPELNHTDVNFYEVEGIGYDFFPKVFDPKVVGKWIKTDDKESLAMARRLIKEEGLLCGASSGSAMCAALAAARNLRAGQRCVVLLPDSVRNYMTKFISDQWLEARHHKTTPDQPLWWWKSIIPQELALPVQTLPATSTPDLAIAALHNSTSFVLAVVDDNGSIIGVFTADEARRRLANLGGSTREPLAKFVLKKFYKVNLDDPSATLGHLSRLLDISPFVVAVRTKHSGAQNIKVEEPIGLLTSQVLLTHIAAGNKQLNGK